MSPRTKLSLITLYCFTYTGKAVPVCVQLLNNERYVHIKLTYWVGLVSWNVVPSALCHNSRPKLYDVFRFESHHAILISVHSVQWLLNFGYMDLKFKYMYFLNTWLTKETLRLNLMKYRCHYNRKIIFEIFLDIVIMKYNTIKIISHFMQYDFCTAGVLKHCDIANRVIIHKSMRPRSLVVNEKCSSAHCCMSLSDCAVTTGT
jgi:hypothetical protein